MSCMDLMYQFYSPYFSYKGATDDVQKLGGSGMLEGPDSGHYLATNTGTNSSEKDSDLDKDSQPKGTQYLNSNCVLFTYFTGDISTVVDEHFSRALSQPSSYTTDRPSSISTLRRHSDTPLMSQRKFPPSFWNSSYQPPCTAPGPHNNFQLTADAYLTSSWYGLHKNWPYHLSSSHNSYAHNIPYSSMDSASRFNSHYGSFMMQTPSMAGRMDSRHGQYDIGKATDTFGTPGYYAMPRFGSDMASNMNLESSAIAGTKRAVNIHRRSGPPITAAQERTLLVT